MSRPEFVDALLDPQAYPEAERPAHVELGETHISWLFFTGDFVYKVKKPVDLGFLDFSTLEQRHIYCQEEFRLNRRISPNVYLGVKEIRERDGRYRLGGNGRVVDYAVKMVQLPRERWLRRLLEAGKVDKPMVERIARRVADFHATAETDETITRIGGIETVGFNTQENFDQVRRHVGITVTRPQYDAVRAYSEAFLDARSLLFAERAATGRIRDCHGDLHADQICIDDEVEFIDCIEFNYRFRYSDVAADVAFLAMDLDRSGRRDLSDAYVAAYVARSGDRRIGDLMTFYKCYRAFTRGKVTGFRLEDDLDDAARAALQEVAASYFDLAHDYAKPSPPLLLITRGVMGSGKTALARALAPRLGAQTISSDALRKRLAGIDPHERHFEAWGEGIYSPEATQRTYAKMHERAAELLADGHSVILDASYRDSALRREAARVARRAGARFLVIQTESPRRVIEQRLVARHLPAEMGGGAESRASDGRGELLDRQFAAFESDRPVAEDVRISVDTSGPAAETVRTALGRIYRFCLRPRPERTTRP